MGFRQRLMISILLLTAICFGIGGTALISVSFQDALSEGTEAAQNSFASIRSTLYLLNSLGEMTDYDSISQALTQMGSGASRWQALLLKSESRTLYQSGYNAMLEQALPPPEANWWACLQVEDTFGRGMLITSTIPAGEETLLLTARFDLSRVYATRQRQTQMYLVIYAAVMVLGLIVSFALSTAMTTRLKRLTRTVRKIAGGNLDIRSNIQSRDEFGQLSRDFDTMADKLQQTIAQQQEHMQRQEAFMGAFAHELKTPMTSIIGYADLLRQGPVDDNTRMMAAGYIFSEGQRLEKLSFKLLDLLLLRRDQITLREVSLPRFVQEIDKALAPVLRGKNVRFICRSDQGRVWLEPDLVKSLLYNLVDNASKAMDGPGMVAMKATVIPGGCQFQVADNGRGMEQSQLDKITEAFYRVDKSRSRQQGGAGLGLALCKQIAELHGGSIQFTSAPGAGTRVRVTLYGKEGMNHG